MTSTRFDMAAGLLRTYRLGKRISLDCEKAGFEKYSFPDIQADWFDESKTLYISGPVGTGKTTLAYCHMVDFVRQGLGSVAECSGPQWYHACRDYSGQSKGMYKQSAVLLLDDIDKGLEDKKYAQALWELFDWRDSHRCWNIITANRGPQELLQWLSSFAGDSTAQAIVDRWKPITKIRLEGESKRGNNDNEEN